MPYQVVEIWRITDLPRKTTLPFPHPVFRNKRMRDSQKTRKQLIKELQETRQQLAVLASSEVERRRAEDALQQSEEKFYKAFRSRPAMMVIVSLENGYYIEVNEAFTHITGYGREELIGHTDDEFNLWLDPPDKEEKNPR